MLCSGGVPRSNPDPVHECDARTHQRKELASVESAPPRLGHVQHRPSSGPWLAGPLGHAFHRRRLDHVRRTHVVRRDPISVLLDAGQARLAKTGLRRIGHVGSRQAFALLHALLAKGRRRNEALTFACAIFKRSSRSPVDRPLRYDLRRPRLLQKYVAWGFVTPKRRITQAGLDELEHARRFLQQSVDVAPLSKESYYPTELRGPTGG